MVKKSACNAGDPSWIHGSGRSPGEGNGNPLQCSCLETPMDREAWRAAKRWTRLNNKHFHFTSIKPHSVAGLRVHLFPCSIHSPGMLKKQPPSGKLRGSKKRPRGKQPAHKSSVGLRLITQLCVLTLAETDKEGSARKQNHLWRGHHSPGKETLRLFAGGSRIQRAESSPDN